MAGRAGFSCAKSGIEKSPKKTEDHISDLHARIFSCCHGRTDGKASSSSESVPVDSTNLRTFRRVSTTDRSYQCDSEL